MEKNTNEADGVKLSEIELKILGELANGLTNREIASKLDLPVEQVNYALRNDTSSKSIYRKIGVRTKFEAASWFERNHGINRNKANQELRNRGQVGASIVFQIGLVLVYICLFLFMFLPVWVEPDKTKFLNFWASIYAVLPAATSIYGLWSIHINQQSHNLFRRPMLFFSIALAGWAVGQIIWAFYNLVLKIIVPFPSLADAGYVVESVFWLIGIYALSRSLSVKLLDFPLVLGVPFLIISTTTFVIVMLARNWAINQPNDPLKFAFDMGYPCFDAASISLLISTMRSQNFRQLPQELRQAVTVIAIGTILFLLADLSFSVSTSLPSDNIWAYYNGCWADFLFTTAFLAIGIGVSRLGSSMALA